MAELRGNWIKLAQRGSSPGARSSHAVTIVGDKAYAFGGEFIPREPVDNKIHVFDLIALTWSIPDATGEIPLPRVGVTMAAVGTIIYVFGGRDKDHTELNDLYSFDTVSSTWTLLSSGNVGPPNRSYHSTAVDELHVYVFGGCGISGRLNDLWAYNVAEKNWVKFPAEKPFFFVSITTRRTCIRLRDLPFVCKLCYSLSFYGPPPVSLSLSPLRNEGKKLRIWRRHRSNAGKKRRCIFASVRSRSLDFSLAFVLSAF